jgi:hypothetical protein
VKTFRTSLNAASLRFPILSDDQTVTEIEAVCLGRFRDASALGEECLLWVIPDQIAEPHFEYVGPRPRRKGPYQNLVAPIGGAA